MLDLLFAATARRFYTAQFFINQRLITGQTKRLEQQRRVSRGILGLVTANSLKVTGVGDDERMLLQLLQLAGHIFSLKFVQS